MVAYLKAHPSSGGATATATAAATSTSTPSSAGEGMSTSAQDPVAVAQEVLRLNEYDDYEGHFGCFLQPTLVSYCPEHEYFNAYQAF